MTEQKKVNAAHTKHVLPLDLRSKLSEKFQLNIPVVHEQLKHNNEAAFNFYDQLLLLCFKVKVRPRVMFTHEAVPTLPS